MMKKILFTVAMAALLASVSSCTEKEMEGKYAPKEKIQAVYAEITEYYNGTVDRQEPKYKSEEWTWTKDQLSRIGYFEQITRQIGDDGEVETDYEQLYTQLFTYDEDGRLTKSEILGWVNASAICEYDGDYLKTMTLYDGDDMYVKYQFNHDEGKKITSFDLTLSEKYFGDKKAVRQLERVNPLRFVLGAEPASRVMAATKSCANRAAKMGCKGDPVIHFDMVWTGDNVSSIRGIYMDNAIKYDFNYDAKNSPFYNLFESYTLESNAFMPFMPLSKNNVTSIAETVTDEGETEYNTLTYTYTYNDKDYPASRAYDETYDNYRYVETLYYEYK